MKFSLFLISFAIAFLLFAVQPLASKLVLPTLGGTPAVWNTAMLTFQTLLLLGYLYAHLTTARLSPRGQVMLHGALVALSFLFLPLTITLAASDAVIERPMWAMLSTLIMQLGLPFFILAATAPLLQAWVSRSRTSLAETPYVLYSASNLGSLLALIGYVVAVEPLLDLTAQRMVWSVGYALGTVLLLVVAWRLVEGASDNAKARIVPEKTSWGERLAWTGIAFLPSALSLGVTNYIAVDIASVPLLWVLPLAIYLLSFVDAFRARPMLVTLCMRIAPLIGLIALLLYGMQAHRAIYGFAFHILAFLTLAFALHGHLARLKPTTGKLTAFYVCMSVGGALGGVLNALIAPMLLTEPLEYPLAVLAASVVAFFMHRQQMESVCAQWRGMVRVAWRLSVNAIALYLLFAAIRGEISTTLSEINPGTAMVAASAAGIVSLILHRGFANAYAACATVMLIMVSTSLVGIKGYDTIYRARNFYGVEKVFNREDPSARYMMHNTTVHGIEPLSEEGPLRPVSYYAALKDVFARVPALRGQVAAIGLGVGSIQCYATPQQTFDYFEINPLVVQLAGDPNYFRYLTDCAGKHRMVLGDGRIMLAKEPDATYGAIILDAFSSDAIPAHLLTREAFAMYVAKLKPHGVILIHTTNRHIDLWPLIGLQAQESGLVAYGRNFKQPEKEPLISETYWVVLARDKADIAQLLAKDEGWQPLTPDAGARAWSDQYSNILPYLKLLRPKP
jgi:hypothetical protein